MCVPSWAHMGYGMCGGVGGQLVGIASLHHVVPRDRIGGLEYGSKCPPARPHALSNPANPLPTSAQSTSTVDASVVISFTFWVLRYSQLQCLLCSRWRLNCNSKPQASRKESSLGSCWPEAWFSLAHICSLKQCENVQVKTYLGFNEADSGGLKISQTVGIKARPQWLVKWLSVL